MTSAPELLSALHSLVRSIDRVHSQGALERRSGVHLDRGLHPVLVTIGDNGPIRTTDLATLLALENSTVSRHAARLEASGLIQRTAIRRDGRASALQLTGTGRRALDAIYEAWNDILADHLQKLPDEGKSLTSEIQTLAEHLDSSS